MKTEVKPKWSADAPAENRQTELPIPATPSAFYASWRPGVFVLNCIGAALLVAAVAMRPAVARAQGALEAWVQRYNGPGNFADFARALVVDTNGNVYVTGSSYDGEYSTAAHGLTIAYSSAGVPLWTNRFHSGVASSDCYANDVAVDKSGNVFVTGNGGGCLTIAYSSAGVPLWTNQYRPPGYTWSGGSAITPDASAVFTK